MKRMNQIVWTIILLMSAVLFAQTGNISGKVTDENGLPLPGANVVVDGTSMGAAAGGDGSFSVTNVPNGTYTVTASVIGYASASESVTVSDGDATVNFSLGQSVLPSEEVVVSASRRAEKIVDAPATIYVINEAKIRRSTGFNVGALMKEVKGADIYQAGIQGIGINARGFMSAYSYRFMMLGDGMNAMLPGAGLSSGGLWPVAKEDLERIEVIMGPSSALYGPNAHNGMVNVISKHPRRRPGGSVVLGAGQNSIITTRFRYAGVSGPIAYKVNFERIAGVDWTTDKEYWADLNGNKAIDSGETIVVGHEEDSKIEDQRMNTAVYYELSSDIELAAGFGQGKQTGWGTTNLGANVLQNWIVNNTWAQFSHPNVFARFYKTTNEAGTTHSVPNRSVMELLGMSRQDAIDKTKYIDDSGIIGAEAQGNIELGSVHLIAGFDYMKFEPISGRTYLDDKGVDPASGKEEGEAIVLAQTGFYGQAQIELPASLSLTAALRFDNHDNYGKNTSPRFGLVWKGLGFGNFRVTWNRAFQAPAILQQMLYLPYGAVGPYGLILRGGGRGFTYADGTKIDPLKVETNETLEFGFKGTPAKGFYLDVNYFQSTYQDFISPLQFIADPLGLGLAGTPGTPLIITHMGDVALDPEYIMTYKNFGEVQISGFDLGIKYALSGNLGVFLNYSKADYSDLKNKKEDTETAAQYAALQMNSPESKWAAGVDLKDFGLKGLGISASARHVDAFDFISGSHRATEAGKGTSITGNPYFMDDGPLGGFTLIDLSLSYEISDKLMLNVSVDNVADTEARQMVGSPATRRLVVGEVRYAF
ncbi:MAG: TonB-dependent receptor [Candidatus Marinimicrobia bacterium]|nr:TonB-dependent receptor [Candidatus Neomarinimicrobiota bacterium]